MFKFTLLNSAVRPSEIWTEAISLKETKKQVIRRESRSKMLAVQNTQAANKQAAVVTAPVQAPVQVFSISEGSVNNELQNIFSDSNDEEPVPMLRSRLAI